MKPTLSKPTHARTPNFSYHLHTANLSERPVSRVLVRVVGSPRPSWNQLTHRRRQAYFADDEDVCDVEHDDLYDKYAPILGKAACQQVTRKNSDAWRSFFRLLDQYHSQDPSVTEKPSPPGYCGNRDDGYGYDPYGLVSPGTIYARSTGAKKSTSEFGVGDVLEDKYDLDCHYQERVTIEVSVTGIVKWRGDDTDWNSSTTKRLTCSMSSTRFAFGQSTQGTATGCLRSHTQS